MRGKTDCFDFKNAEAKNEFESLEKQKQDLSFAKERFSLSLAQSTEILKKT